MVDHETKQKFIEELRKNPVVSAVCQKYDIGRASIYRWKKEDLEFAVQMDEALQESREIVNDLAISGVIGAIKAKDMGITKWWLDSNHPWFQKEKVKRENNEREGLFSLMLRSLKDEITKRKNSNKGHET